MPKKPIDFQGVEYYTPFTANVTINFPEDRVVCQYCPLCRNEDSLKRWKCLLTGEILIYPFNGVGNQCFMRDQIMEFYTKGVTNNE